MVNDGPATVRFRGQFVAEDTGRTTPEASHPGRRGQVGIGTLVVFIALVLVAAIAAGVLINTAGYLQTQAEDAGTDSTDQVANNLNLITAVGVVDGDAGEIGTIRIGVTPTGGANDVNLADVTVQYVSADSFANFVHIQVVTERNEGTVFNTEPVTAEDGTDTVMTAEGDRYEVVVPLNESEPFHTINPDGNDTASDVDSVEVFAVVDENGNFQDTITFDDTVDPTDLEGFEEDVVDGGDADGEDGFRQSYVDTLDNGDTEELGDGQRGELTFTTGTAAQTRTVLRAPQSLAGEEDGDAVNL